MVHVDYVFFMKETDDDENLKLNEKNQDYF